MQLLNFLLTVSFGIPHAVTTQSRSIEECIPYSGPAEAVQSWYG